MKGKKKGKKVKVIIPTTLLSLPTKTIYMRGLRLPLSIFNIHRRSKELVNMDYDLNGRHLSTLHTLMPWEYIYPLLRESLMEFLVGETNLSSERDLNLSLDLIQIIKKELDPKVELLLSVIKQKVLKYQRIGKKVSLLQLFPLEFLENKESEQLKTEFKKIEEIKISHYIINVSITAKNMQFAVLDDKEKLIFWMTPKSSRILGIKKDSFNSIEKVAREIGKKIERISKRDQVKVILRFNGLIKNRLAVVRGLTKSPITILALQDITSEPFNGCRPPRARKV